MSIVVSAEVAICKRHAAQRDRVLATIRPGNLLGEMAFLDGQTRSATAIASKDTALLVVTRSAYDEVVRVHPSLVGNLLPGLIRVLILPLRRAHVKLVDRHED